MSPELIHNKYHQTSDIWSIGVILYQMIYDDLPFKGYKEDEIINNIKKLNIHPPEKAHHSHLSKGVIDLIKRMLIKNPFKRIKVEECLNHEWFTGIINNNGDSDDNSLKTKKLLENKDNNKIKIEEINTDIKKKNVRKNNKDSKNIIKASSISESIYFDKNDSFSSDNKTKSKISNNTQKKLEIYDNDSNDELNIKLIKNKNEIKNKINIMKAHEMVKCYSSNMIEVLSNKSNGQKLSPLLIDTIKYIRYYIQINFKRNVEEGKISNIFEIIICNKRKKNNTNIDKIDNDDLKVTYEDLYIGYLNYIDQKRLILDSYSDNKKLFVNICNLINENKKNGNAINYSYDKNDFIRILIILKEKYCEHNLEKSYQQLKKSNINEIINCLNEIDKKK